MRLRIYLDTSVFSAILDARKPERQESTREFWMRLAEFDAATSELARSELGQTPELNLRTQLLELLNPVSLIPITGDMLDAAWRYIQSGAFTRPMYNDAVHVAAAVLTRQDVLVSWNFRHLVNRRRRALINQVNVSSGWPSIEIVAPPEL